MKNKNKFSKAIRIGSFFLALCVPIVIIFGFSGIKNLTFNSNWLTNIITMGGSSAVFPLASSFGKSYFSLSNTDVNVVAGGSGKGISYAATLTKDVGNASKNPYNDVQKEYLSNWIDNKIKTVTIAWDAIAIIYKPTSLNDSIIIDKDNISTLYNIFWGQSEYPLSSLGLNETGVFRPYARSGGADASGTATSFLKESDLIDYKTLNKQLQNDLIKGSYGSQTISTNESNLETWNQIKSNNYYGSISYLSLGFVKANESEIKKAGFKVASYKNKNNNMIFDPLSIDTKLSNNSYSWFSPLNCMFSTIYSQKYVLDFIWWVLTSEEANSIIIEKYFTPLDNESKAKMFLNNSYSTWSTLNEFLEANDVLLSETRTQFKDWYGAYK